MVKLFAYATLALLIFHFSSCVEKKEKNRYLIQDSGLENNLRKLSFCADSNIILEVYIDSTDKIIEVSNKNCSKYKIAFTKNGFVGYVNNVFDEECREQLWLNDDHNIIYDKYERNMKRRLSVSNSNSPIVAYTSSFNQNGNWLLSENKAFDFVLMKPVSHEFVEYISLAEDMEYEVGKPVKLKFNIESKFKNHQLYTGNYDPYFHDLQGVESMQVNNDFEIVFTPKNRNDTLRFILKSVGKSIYYELPIVAR